MTETEMPRWLSRSVDREIDHVLGNDNAEITLVEYGSYACPHCRAANEEIARLRDHFGDRVRYVFRHLPIAGVPLAMRAAELAESTRNEEEFWHVHLKLMTRSAELTAEDIVVVTADLGLTDPEPAAEAQRELTARNRVEADIASARASGVRFTPTFFINERRYDGPWDESSISDAMLGRLGHRVQSAALDFASWGPSAGALLLIATIVAVVISNTSFGVAFDHILHTGLGLVLGDTRFQLSLLHWINDGLLSIFFIVVGLEIKRELTVGRLTTLSTATLPIAAAIGGMIVPALMYFFLIPDGPWSHGWGIPMATDTAFAVALIVAMGRRVPVELRIFLTAAAIVDDIGSIAVVAIFYSSGIDLWYTAAAGIMVVLLWMLNSAHVYRASAYLLCGAFLWVFVYASGFHASLAGILFALFIPTRAPANLPALMMQADTIIAAEAKGRDALRHGPSLPALRLLDAIHDRIESPADRMLRYAGARSSYLILPIFALANAGVEFETSMWSGHSILMIAIACALFIGKPLGILLACALVVGTGLARKPDAYSWQQLAGAASLAGIGFTMSLFIAGQALSVPVDFAAAKVAVFVGSILAAVIGSVLLLSERTTPTTEPTKTQGSHA